LDGRNNFKAQICKHFEENTMRMQLVFAICITASIGIGYSQDARVVPSVTSVSIADGTVTLLHLAPGYTTSVKLPEEVSSVVLGDPASFKAEHSDLEPRLVFLKPISPQPAESNALITTKSGQEVTLQLVSPGKTDQDPKVDFLVQYRPPESLLVGVERRSFLIADTRPIAPAASSVNSSPHKADPVADALEAQERVSTPAWQGKEFGAAVGPSVTRGRQTILGFSIFNSSRQTIELLPPQIELVGSARGKKDKQIKAEPIPISEYRMTSRRLAPGQRSDGVVVFERPAFKGSTENLELQLARADQVDRPILLPVQFTAASQGGVE
jgi:hypothetical protein